jgi:hypothetical protein
MLKVAHPRRPITAPQLSDAFASIFNIALLLLLLLGVCGLIYKALKPGGWMGHVLDAAWHAHPGFAALAGMGALAGLVAAKRWLDATSEDGSRGDILVYAGLALGLFFAFELFVNGSI